MPATKRKFAAPLGLLINSSSTVDSSVASTSPSTGAFVISGGAGIGDTVNVKGHINLWNNPNTFYTGLRAGTLTTSTYYILPSNFPGTGTSILQSDISGTLSWVPMTVGASSGATSANINVVGAGSSNLAHSILFTPIASSSGSAVSSDTTLSFNPSTEILSVSGLAVTAATGSSNTTTGAFVVTGGVGFGGTLNIGADLSISGLTTLTYTSEKLNTKTSATGTVTHDLSTGSIFYHSSISNNFTANITNVPTTNDRAIGVTLVLAQGVTAYMSTALQIDGSAQTIKWVNNSTPAGTASKVDIVGFSLIRTGSAWTVLGQYSTYG